MMLSRNLSLISSCVINSNKVSFLSSIVFSFFLGPTPRGSSLHPSCSYPNDHTFRFCQSCGYFRRYLHPQKPKVVSFDLDAIDKRLEDLQQQYSSTAYAKQKASLKDELEGFLYALPGQKSITNALPIDICRFLVFKDAKGKTQPHRNGCLHVGKKGLFDCRCPCRLAYSTVDSYIGKLRSIFAEAGRQGEWNRTLLLGNPATDLLVKIYLKQVTAKQLQARVTPKQAVPIFPDKLLLISNYLKKRLAISKNAIDREESSNLGSPPDTDLICDSLVLMLSPRVFFWFFSPYQQQHC